LSVVYDEALVAIVSEKDARYEIEDQHCLSFEEFQAEVGRKDWYKGWEVLWWLGY
tara:strand:- start:61 stop:225 length:165 start_codon:yes stop_codon:yes gene_type:complete